VGLIYRLREKLGLIKTYEHTFGERFHKEIDPPLKAILDSTDGMEKSEKWYAHHGLTESMLGHYDESLDVLWEGCKKYPHNLEIQFFLIRTTGDKAKVCQRIDLVKQTIETWDEFIKAHPNEKFSFSRGTADAYVERGFLKQFLGDIDAAQEDYKTVQEIDPNIPLPKIPEKN
jgi:tetratricopeptide (TPR) repeat protein